ncbi:hypothetical protein [Draconibacterium sediminis]|uniref:Uncharacterized protein n=1 Tax=Draconibacterium sediminis TaxID=1544798 RepID=A0A0D8JEL8_9BACT|nr:hypothetical protein [Draconibacterium sediminis]KJF44273.1 hypothetical protein LH29_01790 [Draconibacterium sediminis]
MKYIHILGLLVFFFAACLVQAQNKLLETSELNAYQKEVKRFVPELIDAAMGHCFEKTNETEKEIAGRKLFKEKYIRNVEWQKREMQIFLQDNSWPGIKGSYVERLIDKYIELEKHVIDEQSALYALDDLARFDPLKYKFYSNEIALSLAANYKAGIKGLSSNIELEKRIEKSTDATTKEQEKNYAEDTPEPTDDILQSLEQVNFHEATDKTTTMSTINFYVLVAVIFVLFVIIIILLYKLRLKNMQLTHKKEDLYWQKNNSNTVSKRDYDHLERMFKDLESDYIKLKNINTGSSTPQNVDPSEKIFETLPGDGQKKVDEQAAKPNSPESEMIGEKEKQSKQDPKEYFFDDFNNGMFLSKAKSEPKKCVYKITSTNDSFDILELIVDKNRMANYITNKKIYLPEYLCNIKYVPGGNQSKIQNMIPGKVHLENDKWIIQDKIKLEIK